MTPSHGQGSARPGAAAPRPGPGLVRVGPTGPGPSVTAAGRRRRRGGGRGGRAPSLSDWQADLTEHGQLTCQVRVPGRADSDSTESQALIRVRDGPMVSVRRKVTSAVSVFGLKSRRISFSVSSPVQRRSDSDRASHAGNRPECRMPLNYAEASSRKQSKSRTVTYTICHEKHCCEEFCI